ncbi:UDP-N-acetylmuramoyl-tripeptide--D-alanyl-D-alanine ligase [Arthrobacter sp. RIT-PI-e]|uniref:UDP-N-acetylmuramoyl-tripeptide--D-alanyl-D- alanine ligase n=1 Tax=Arthrobacter sp. RIT-PI-e TaxID=1681197 RepID=UPI00067642E7|nr:UDP-N-acetylmuramoyl-tripeptide--D-alanyl-D-alanine ligase [Arthrobacter sp. RIT-PI-e]KNC17672.1 UDP-N-acetylmuramoyl-tripeptide--D-alanyl-D-alanine ligase [Arthrobacter sp. RIT-PI-e]
MIEFHAAEIAALTGGTLVGAEGAGHALTVTSAVTDSRESRPGGLFVAKPGEESDGHLFIGAAFGQGAVLALAEREVTAEDGTPYPAVIVPDAVLAMGQLAAEWLRRLRAAGEITVVGITGSAGKTTTKDLLAGILAEHAPTVAPRGSYNGEVGVPLTVFEADRDTRYLVIEMGATKPGHIAYLASLVQPDIGVVLGVGSAHAGEFGGVENIARAKGELFEALPPSGTAVINADDERVLAMQGRTRARTVFFTSSTDFAADGSDVVLALNSTTTPEGHPSFTLAFPDGSEHDVVSPLLGLHHTGNLLAAASVAYGLGCAPGRIAASLRVQAAASRWRMERTERADGVTVINDAYNANPESMRAALRTLAELGRAGRRTWAVLGEMLELGESSIEEHDLLGRVVVRLNISKLVCVGPNTRALYNGAVLEGSWGSEALHVDDADAAEQLLTAELRPGDIVLLKSSNGAGLRFLGDRIAAMTAAPSTDPPPASAEDGSGAPGKAQHP